MTNMPSDDSTNGLDRTSADQGRLILEEGSALSLETVDMPHTVTGIGILIGPSKNSCAIRLVLLSLQLIQKSNPDNTLPLPGGALRGRQGGRTSPCVAPGGGLGRP